MKTRKDYLDGKVSHREYYSQFVTDATIEVVRRFLGKEITASTDEHFNDIKLRKWDGLAQCMPVGTGDRLKEAGDYLTLAGAVCILKASARQLREAS